MTRRTRTESAQSPGKEHHSERLRRLVANVYEMLTSPALGLAPGDAVWVAEGAADRVRRDFEAAKQLDRAGARRARAAKEGGE